MTSLIIGISTLIFLSFLFLWKVRQLQVSNISSIHSWSFLLLTVSAPLLYLGRKNIKSHEIEKAYKFWGISLILGIVFIAFQLIGLEQTYQDQLHIQNIRFPMITVHTFFQALLLIFNYRIFKKIGEYSVHSKEDHHVRISFSLTVFSFLAYCMILIIL